jgi:hypothetical protein
VPVFLSVSVQVCLHIKNDPRHPRPYISLANPKSLSLARLIALSRSLSLPLSVFLSRSLPLARSLTRWRPRVFSLGSQFTTAAARHGDRYARAHSPPCVRRHLVCATSTQACMPPRAHVRSRSLLFHIFPSLACHFHTLALVSWHNWKKPRRSRKALCSWAQLSLAGAALAQPHRGLTETPIHFALWRDTTNQSPITPDTCGNRNTDTAQTQTQFKLFVTVFHRCATGHARGSGPL